MLKKKYLKFWVHWRVRPMYLKFVFFYTKPLEPTIIYLPIAPIKWLLAFKSSWKVLKAMPNTLGPPVRNTFENEVNQKSSLMDQIRAKTVFKSSGELLRTTLNKSSKPITFTARFGGQSAYMRNFRKLLRPFKT